MSKSKLSPTWYIQLAKIFRDFEFSICQKIPIKTILLAQYEKTYVWLRSGLPSRLSSKLSSRLFIILSSRLSMRLRCWLSMSLLRKFPGGISSTHWRVWLLYAVLPATLVGSQDRLRFIGSQLSIVPQFHILISMDKLWSTMALWLQ
jgi:hypothetical protein